MKIAVLQKFNRTVESIADITTINKQWYAHKHGYTFINDETDYNVDDRSATWLIELSILNTMKTNPEIDWIFWTDVDSIITNTDIKLEDIIKYAEPDYHIIANMWNLPSRTTFADLTAENIVTIYTPGMWFMLHTGNWLIRNCQWSFDFLTKVYNDKRLLMNKDIANHPTGDEIGLTIYYLGYPECRKHIKIIPGSLFISIPPSLNKTKILQEFQGSDFILHVPFQPINVKEYELCKYMSYIK